MNVGVIGLGRDGLAVLRHLLNKTAHDLWVYDPAGRPGAGAAKRCTSAAEVFDRCEVVVLAAESARELCAVLGAAADFIREGQVFLSLTDTSPALAHSLCNAMRRRFGARYLDCGLFGEVGLERAFLLFVGGNGEAFALVQPLLRCFAPDCRYMGPSGRGSAARLLCRSLEAQRQNALRETLSLADALGLGARGFSEALTRFEKGGAPSSAEQEALTRDAGVAAEMARRAGLDLGGLFAAAEAPSGV